MRRAAPRRVRVCRFMRARTYTRPRAHRDPVCRRDFAKREEVRTCTMHECVHIHTEPGLDLFPAELRDAWRRERNARGRAKRALRRDARIHGRRPSARTAEGLVKGAHIFDLCRGMCATSKQEGSLEEKKSIGNVVSVTDSKSFKKKEIKLYQDISVVYKIL